MVRAINLRCLAALYGRFGRALLIVLPLSSGCMTAHLRQTIVDGLPAKTVGHVGCTEHEISVRVVKLTTNNPFGSQSDLTTTWEAFCRGQHYVCSSDPATGVACAPAVTAAR